MQRVQVRTQREPLAIAVTVRRTLADAGLDVPVRLWDGSEHGPDDRGYRVALRHPWSLRSMLLPPTDLNVGEAYLRDDLEVEGSMVAALRDLAGSRDAVDQWSVRTRVIFDLLRLPAPPANGRIRDVRLRGRLHSPERDRQAIAHHYDVGNDFFELFLDRNLVYSCAYFHQDDPPRPGDDPDALDRAQERKLELICRKLRLQPGERLLDIGCGWGSLLIHAARNHGVFGLGVTLSQQQAELARERVTAAGLAGRVEIRLADYRELSNPADAVASVGMFEHVGADQLASYFKACRRLTRRGGRFLNHGITTGNRNTVSDLSEERNSFASRHVFPDGALVPAHVAAGHLERAGFELIDLEQLRPHYARTLEQWVARLEQRTEAARDVAGETILRTWRAYMAASVIGFESGELGVVQLLGTRGDAALPLGRAWMIPSLQEQP